MNTSLKTVKNKIVVGIDQSYKRTGITVLEDDALIRKMFYIDGSGMTHASYRRKIRCELSMILTELKEENRNKVEIIMERVRLRSKGRKNGEDQNNIFLSLNYIQSTAALCGVIIEVGEQYDFPVYSVDTRAWKSAIVGTSKPQENDYGLPPEKYPTILYVKNRGLLKNIIEVYEGRATKGIMTISEHGYRYRARIIDDVADSFCIAKYGFLPEGKQKLKQEEF